MGSKWIDPLFNERVDVVAFPLTAAALMRYSCASQWVVSTGKRQVLFPVSFPMTWTIPFVPSCMLSGFFGLGMNEDDMM